MNPDEAAAEVMRALLNLDRMLGPPPWDPDRPLRFQTPRARIDAAKLLAAGSRWPNFASLLIANDPAMLAGQKTIDAGRHGGEMKKGRRTGGVTDDELRAFVKDYRTKYPTRSWTEACQDSARYFRHRLPPMRGEPEKAIVNRGRAIRKRIPDTRW